MATTETTSSEEFSFPISAETTCSFMDSPPLWRCVPSTSHVSLSCSSSSSSSYFSSSLSTSSSSSISSSSHSEESKRLPSWSSASSTRNVSNNRLERKSFSSVEESMINHSPIEMDEADKMDLLWEDFNEDVLISRRMVSMEDDSCYSAPSSTSSSSSASGSSLSRGDLVEFRCVPPSFKVSRGISGGEDGGAVVTNRKKQGVVVIVKVLKRWFLLQQEAVKKKRSTW